MTLARSDSAHIPRRLDIQGLRGVAILLVVLFHAELPIPGGFVGVDVFFVISGFVITAMLKREFERTGRIDFRSFYARRVRRLLPALALVTLVTLVAVLIFQPPLGLQQGSASTAMAASLFLANARIFLDGAGYFNDSSTTNPFLHLWSLSVEEQFYLVFPAVLFGAWGWGRRLLGKPALGSLVAVVGIVVVSLGLSVAFAVFDKAALLAFYSSPTRAWEFGVGALVALGAHRLIVLNAKIAVLLSVLGGVAVAASAFVIAASDNFPGYVALLPVVGAAALIAAGTASDGATGWLAVRPLTFLGDVSYSWYLWHWPVVVFTKQLWSDNAWILLLTSVLAIIPSWLSEQKLERLLRTTPKLQSGRRTIALALVCILTPAACAAIVMNGANRSWGSSTMAQLAVDRDDITLGDKSGCFPEGSYSSSNASKCLWTAPNSTGTILLAGDSHANNLSDGMKLVASNLGYDLRESTGPGCSFTSQASREKRGIDNCGELYEATLAHAFGATAPNLVVLSHNSIARINGLSEIGESGANSVWKANLRNTLQMLSDRNIPVLFVYDVPALGTFPEPCMGGSVTNIDCEHSWSDSKKRQVEARHVEEEAIAGFANVTTIDIASKFCGGEVCNAIVGDRMMFRDNTHLTAEGSRYVAPSLQTATSDALKLAG